MLVLISKWLGRVLNYTLFTWILVFGWSFFHLLSCSTIRKWWKVGFLSVTLAPDLKKLTWQIQVLQWVIRFFINSLSHVTLFYEPLFLFPEAINFSNICKLMYSPVWIQLHGAIECWILQLGVFKYDLFDMIFLSYYIYRSQQGAWITDEILERETTRYWKSIQTSLQAYAVKQRPKR